MKTQNNTSVRFSPTAWAKLVYLRDLTDNEVGGFGISKADNLLFVEDFEIVKQNVNPVSVLFDDDSVADFFESQVKKGNKPQQFARIWVHTHPGSSSSPSATDEETFTRVFGGCDWSVMVIVAQNSNSYARIRFSAAAGCEFVIPIEVDYDCSFDSPDFKAWKKQYTKNVSADKFFNTYKGFEAAGRTTSFGKNLSSAEILDELELMEPFEREYFLEELAIRSEFWDESEEV